MGDRRCDSEDVAEEIVLDDSVPQDFQEDDMDDDTMQDGGEETLEDFVDDSIQGFFDHKQPIYSVAIHPIDQSIVCSGGGDDRAYLWNVSTGETYCQLKEHADSVVSLAFSADGQYIATGGMDGKVIVSTALDGQLVCELDGPSEITVLTWHPRGHVLVVGSADNTIWMWNISYGSGSLMQLFTGHGASVSHVAFTPDGKLLVSAGEDCTLIVWDPKSGSIVSRDTGRFHFHPVNTFAISHDSTTLITGSQDCKCNLINIATGRVIGLLQGHTESVESLDFCEAMSFIASASVDNTVVIWEGVTMRVRHTLVHQDTVTKVKFLKNSTMLVTSSADKSLRLWEARTGECLRVFKGHQETVLDFDLSGARIVSGSDDGVALVWAMDV